MKTYLLPNRSLPLDDSWEVIVVGGGPSGCTAAAAAAREGARTLLIEATSALGGSGTSALVPLWCPFSDRTRIIYRGLAQQVLERCKQQQPRVRAEQLDWVPIDAELLKRVYDDLLAECGATVLFQTMLSTVEVAPNGDVTALVVTNKRGLSALKAKVYVDCTGDADLCTWAGADFQKGDAKGDLMPATHCFILGNVDEVAFNTTCEGGRRMMGNHPTTRIYDIIASGRFPLITDAHVVATVVGPGTIGVNAGHLWNVDNTNPESVSRAVAQGRKLAAQLRDAFAEFYPEAFGHCHLVASGSVIGARESRRITGDYVLTLGDYIARRRFDDEICRNAYFIDLHHSQAEATEHTAERADGFSQPTENYGPGESHGIPYRCLTPRGLRNVLVAGRSISCDRPVQASIRVMPVCLAMGEAAGMAAAHALKHHQADVHAVDVTRLRQRLIEEGAYLPTACSRTP
jgi:hypothetical protein